MSCFCFVVLTASEVYGKITVMTENLKPEHITATLSRKLMTSSPWRTLIIILYVMSGIELVLVLSMLISIPLTLGHFDDDMKIATICCGIATAISIFVTVCLHCRSYHDKNRVALCLKDAVLIMANVVSVDDELIPNGRARGTHRVVAIEVTFKYDGELYAKKSERKGKPFFSTAYVEHLGSTTVAYSPEFDEVMFIDPMILDRMKNSLPI